MPPPELKPRAASIPPAPPPRTMTAQTNAPWSEVDLDSLLIFDGRHTPEELQDVLDAVRARLEAVPPLSPELFALIWFDGAACWRAAGALPAGVLADLRAWWAGVRAIGGLPAATDAAVEVALEALEAGPAGRDRVRSLARSDSFLAYILKHEPREYHEALLERLETLAGQTVTQLCGIDDLGASRLGHPFYMAVAWGSAAVLDAAARWCRPSPRAVGCAWALALQQAGSVDEAAFTRADSASCAANRAAVFLWFAAELADFGPAELEAVGRRLRRLGSPPEEVLFFRQLLHETPALTPQAAAALLESLEAPLGAWARDDLLAIARI